MNPNIERRLNRRYAGATRQSPVGKTPRRRPEFSTGDDCLICGNEFKDTNACPHSVSDNETAIRVWFEERLLA